MRAAAIYSAVLDMTLVLLSHNFLTGHKAIRKYREVGYGGVEYNCFAPCVSRRVLALLVRRELTSLVGWSRGAGWELEP